MLIFMITKAKINLSLYLLIVLACFRGRGAGETDLFRARHKLALL